MDTSFLRVMLVSITVFLGGCAIQQNQECGDTNPMGTHRVIWKPLGPTNQSMRLRFDFDTGQTWTSVVKDIRLPPDAWGEIRFRISGDARTNRLEVKLEDETGRVFGQHIPLTDISMSSKVVSVRMDELRQWAGEKGNPSTWVKLHLVVATSGANGQGTLTFDQFQYNPSCLFIDIGQVGYRPFDPKQILVRGLLSSTNARPHLFYEVNRIDRAVPIRSGRLVPVEFDDWQGHYWIADISDLTEAGRYSVLIYADSTEDPLSPAESAPFAVGDHPLSSITAPAQFNFFRGMRWDPKRHPNDAIPGGYYDTSYDTCKRPWSLTHVLRAFACYVKEGRVQSFEAGRPHPDAVEELLYLTPYCIDLVQADGAVSWVGLNEFTRERATDKSLIATCYNLVALLEAAGALKTQAPELGRAAYEAALKSWSWIERQQVAASAEIGGVLSAALKLYAFTNHPDYARRAQTLLPRLLIAQSLDYARYERNACGLFKDDWLSNRYNNSYKFFVHGQGAILDALVEYCTVFDRNDPGWMDAYYAGNALCYGYLLEASKKSPYGIVPLWPEPENGGERFRFLYGPKFIPQDPVYHALNGDYIGYAFFLLRWAGINPDPKFVQVAKRQLQWVVGQNPLGLSMITGVGPRYAPVFAEFWNHGANIRGCIPNGIMFDGDGQPTYMAETYLSGEEWLPHNAYWLLALTRADAEAHVSVDLSSRQGLEPVTVSVADEAGRLIPEYTRTNTTILSFDLPPDRIYTLHAKQGKRRWEKTFPAIAGCRTPFLIDFETNLLITLTADSKPIAGQPLVISATLTNAGYETVATPLRVYLRGASCEEPLSLNASVPPGGVERFRWTVTPSGLQPLFIRADVPALPGVSDEYFAIPEGGTAYPLPESAPSHTAMEIKDTAMDWAREPAITLPDTRRRPVDLRLGWDSRKLYIRAETGPLDAGISLAVEMGPSGSAYIDNNEDFVQKRFPLARNSTQVFDIAWADLKVVPFPDIAFAFNAGLRIGDDVAVSDWHRQPVRDVFSQGIYEIGRLVLKSPTPMLDTFARVTASSFAGAEHDPARACGTDATATWKPADGNRQAWFLIELNEARPLTGLRLFATKPSVLHIAGSVNGRDWMPAAECPIEAGRENDCVLSFPAPVRFLRIQPTSPTEFSRLQCFAGRTAFSPSEPAAVQGATASSVQAPEFDPLKAFDGRRTTRYASAFADGEWLQADLGTVRSVSRLQLEWEVAYAQNYRVQTSTDGKAWHTVYETTQGQGGMEFIAFEPAPARFIRLVFDKRGTNYGSSLYEAVIYTLRPRAQPDT